MANRRPGSVRALVYLEGPVSKDVKVEHYVRSDLKYEFTKRPKPSSDPKSEFVISMKVPIDKLLHEWSILATNLKEKFKTDPFGDYLPKVWVNRIQSDWSIEPIVYLISKFDFIQVKRALAVRMLYLYYNARLFMPPRWRYASENERDDDYNHKMNNARANAWNAYKTLEELCLNRNSSRKNSGLNAYEYLQAFGKEYAILKEISISSGASSVVTAAAVDAGVANQNPKQGSNTANQSEIQPNNNNNEDDVNLALIEWEEDD